MKKITKISNILLSIILLVTSINVVSGIAGFDKNIQAEELSEDMKFRMAHPTMPLKCIADRPEYGYTDSEKNLFKNMEKKFVTFLEEGVNVDPVRDSTDHLEDNDPNALLSCIAVNSKDVYPNLPDRLSGEDVPGLGKKIYKNDPELKNESGMVDTSKIDNYTTALTNKYFGELNNGRGDHVLMDMIQTYRGFFHGAGGPFTSFYKSFVSKVDLQTGEIYFEISKSRAGNEAGDSWIYLGANPGISYMHYRDKDGNLEPALQRNPDSFGHYFDKKKFTDFVNKPIKRALQLVEEAKDLDDYAKLNYLADYITETDYDGEAASAKGDELYAKGYMDSFTMLHVFDDDPNTRCVCEGYAQSFQYVVQRSTFNSPNIFAYLMYSSNHIWNGVIMDDGKAYIWDLTGDTRCEYQVSSRIEEGTKIFECVYNHGHYRNSPSVDSYQDYPESLLDISTTPYIKDSPCSGIPNMETKVLSKCNGKSPGIYTVICPECGFGSSGASEYFTINQPQNFGSTSVEARKVVLSWDRIKGFEGRGLVINNESYTISRDDGTGFKEIATNIKDLSYTDYFVTPGTHYEYKITGTDEKFGTSQEATFELITPVSTAGISSVNSQDTTCAKTNITWNSVSGSNVKYSLLRKNSNGEFETIASNLTTTSYTNNNLDAETLYVYKIKATDSNNNTNYSDEFGIKTLAHDYSMTVTKLVNGEEKGNKLYHCNVCNNEKTEEFNLPKPTVSLKLKTTSNTIETTWNYEGNEEENQYKYDVEYSSDKVNWKYHLQNELKPVTYCEINRSIICETIYYVRIRVRRDDLGIGEYSDLKEIKTRDHVYDPDKSEYIKKNATPTTEGIKAKECSVCRETIETPYIWDSEYFELDTPAGSDNSYMDVGFASTKGEVMTKLFSREEINKIEFGRLYGKVKITSKDYSKDISEEDKNLLLDTLNSDSSNLYKDYVLASISDISLSKQSGTNEEEEIKEISSGSISIKMKIPEYILNNKFENTDFVMLRLHNGNVSILPTQLEDNEVIFATDKFSTYALAYKPISLHPLFGLKVEDANKNVEVLTQNSKSLKLTLDTENNIKMKDVKFVVEDPTLASVSVNTTKNTASVKGLKYGTTKIKASVDIAGTTYSDEFNLKVDFYDTASYKPESDSHKAIYWTVDNNIATGFDKEYWGPNLNITRADFAIMLYRHAGKVWDDSYAQDVFSDNTYKPESDKFRAIQWAKATGLSNGYAVSGSTNKIFKPKQNITRNEIVIMLYRYAKYLNKLQDVDLSTVEVFNDIKSFKPDSDKYKSIIWCAALGISKGYDGGLFKPANPCTRKEFAIFLYRLDNNLNN